MDDLIDVLSDTDTLGKPSGRCGAGKRTLMVIHALKQPPSQSKDDLLAVLGKGDNVTAEQVAKGHQALTHDLGSIDYAKAKAESYHRKAHDCLDRLSESPALRALRELTDYQLNRIY